MSSTEAVMDIYTSSAGAIDGAPRAHLRFAQTNAALVYLSDFQSGFFRFRFLDAPFFEHKHHYPP